MITAEQAKEIFDAFLAQTTPYPAEPGVTAVFISVQEHRFGWEFRYQSSTYAQTGDPRDLWIGTGPVVVDRRDGHIEELGGKQFGDTVAEYQHQYDQQTSTDVVP
ncbi:YrhB domain-containing protein [Streptomyces sp. NPDC046859]|uniref:YrhB domain-containing protein n=1 Tax=Streptomyces sp. NPDC046859 TaxID=3155734 RepID=UPI0033CEA6AF